LRAASAVACADLDTDMRSFNKLIERRAPQLTRTIQYLKIGPVRVLVAYVCVLAIPCWRCPLTQPRTHASRSVHFALTALACYSEWISDTCDEANTCGYADMYPLLQAALVIAVLASTGQLVDALYVVLKYPRKSRDLSTKKFLWLFIAKTAVRFSSPSMLAGVLAVWMSTFSAWTCDSAKDSTMAMGVVHIFGSMLILVGVPFSGSSKSSIVRMAIVLDVGYVGAMVSRASSWDQIDLLVRVS